MQKKKFSKTKQFAKRSEAHKTYQVIRRSVCALDSMLRFVPPFIGQFYMRQW
jgi:hypothetical protein